MATKNNKKKESTSTVKTVFNTANSINKQMQYTAGEVAKEVMANGKIVKEIAGQAAKELNDKVAFEGSVKKIRYTAENINKELKTAAVEVADVVLKNGKKVSSDVSKAAKNRVAKIDLEAGVNTVKTTAKNINEFSLKTADEALDGAVKNGERWQKIATKAVNGSLKIAAKNQEMIFTTLETVKGQLMHSADRFKQLFSKN